MKTALSTCGWTLLLAATALLALGCQQDTTAAGLEASERPIATAPRDTYTGVTPAAKLAGDATSTSVTVAFDDPPALTKQFIAYNSSIRLTPEQERIKAEALAAIPAPCCSDFSLATCCCPCNLAKSAWGLAKHLIAERGYGVDEVRAAAVRWVEAVNPAGFSGDVCATGGCNRSFEQNGCGGMNEDRIL